ncbi:MAG: 2-hydroxychromene-2-carboxylate isomerase [Myxococcota bacterium]|nr:2-hydroxychromene-2-carboxylate isomerase [Myxococcota bacterium]
MKLEFFFDYGSPYSYLADTRLADLQARTACEIEYRPMLLGGVFKATGNRSPAEETVLPKLKYQSSEMQRWVEYYGVPFVSNPFFPINTLQLMRVAHAAQATGAFEAFHRSAFKAMWEQEKNLGDSKILVEVLECSGLDGGALVAMAANPEVKESLMETSQEAVARGAFGAPTFFVGESMFFGNDRLDFVERALVMG